MADDDKKNPENPKGRPEKSTSDKILNKQKEVAEKQVKRQETQIKLAEAQKKIDEAMNRGQTTLANSLSRSLDSVRFALEKDPNNADLIAGRLEETEDIIKNVIGFIFSLKFVLFLGIRNIKTNQKKDCMKKSSEIRLIHRIGRKGLADHGERQRSQLL